MTEEEYYDLIVDFAEISLERKRREEIINSEEYKRREEKRLEQQCRFFNRISAISRELKLRKKKKALFY